MGLADTFGRDDKFEIKTNSFIAMVEKAAMARANSELMMNAINCDVPYRYIREIMTGISEEPEDNGLDPDPAPDSGDAGFEVVGYDEVEE